MQGRARKARQPQDKIRTKKSKKDKTRQPPQDKTTHTRRDVTKQS
jgi:hypothetical protein